jgi:hypothetical protein
VGRPCPSLAHLPQPRPGGPPKTPGRNAPPGRPCPVLEHRPGLKGSLAESPSQPRVGVAVSTLSLQPLSRARMELAPAWSGQADKSTHFSPQEDRRQEEAECTLALLWLSEGRCGCGDPVGELRVWGLLCSSAHKLGWVQLPPCPKHPQPAQG